ncbi:MAG: PFL_4669 family integrating conjugative element protein [Geminicoccaceae bacterium]
MTEIIEDATTELTDPDSTVPAPSVRHTLPRRPGRLKGEVTLTLHTLQAGELLLGRPATDDKPAIPSINNFGNHIDQILTAADSGDIYAAAELVRIDEQLEAVERLLDIETRKLRTSMAANSRFSITAGLSTEPVPHRLRLTSPYAHWVARLIGLYDELVALALSMHRAGYIHDKERDMIVAHARKAIRSCFYAVRKFRVTGTTRDDFEKGTARASEAAAKFGDLPAEILEGKRKPAYLH